MSQKIMTMPAKVAASKSAKSTKGLRVKSAVTAGYVEIKVTRVGG